MTRVFKGTHVPHVHLAKAAVTTSVDKAVRLRYDSFYEHQLAASPFVNTSLLMYTQ